MSRNSIKSDLARLDRLKDRDIDYSEIPPPDPSVFKKATQAWPPAKQQVAVRLDVDVLDWLKLHGKCDQTRLNHILRAAMEHQAPRRSRTPKIRERSRGVPMWRNEARFCSLMASLLSMCKSNLAMRLLH